MKKHAKKLISIFILTVLSVSIFASCKKEPSPSPPKKFDQSLLTSLSNTIIDSIIPREEIDKDIYLNTKVIITTENFKNKGQENIIELNVMAKENYYNKTIQVVFDFNYIKGESKKKVDSYKIYYDGHKFYVCTKAANKETYVIYKELDYDLLIDIIGLIPKKFLTEEGYSHDTLEINGRKKNRAAFRDHYTSFIGLMLTFVDRIQLPGIADVETVKGTIFSPDSNKDEKGIYIKTNKIDTAGFNLIDLAFLKDLLSDGTKLANIEISNEISDRNGLKVEVDSIIINSKDGQYKAKASLQIKNFKNMYSTTKPKDFDKSIPDISKYTTIKNLISGQTTFLVKAYANKKDEDYKDYYLTFDIDINPNEILKLIKRDILIKEGKPSIIIDTDVKNYKDRDGFTITNEAKFLFQMTDNEGNIILDADYNLLKSPRYMYCTVRKKELIDMLQRKHKNEDIDIPSIFIPDEGGEYYSTSLDLNVVLSPFTKLDITDGFLSLLAGVSPTETIVGLKEVFAKLEIINRTLNIDKKIITVSKDDFDEAIKKYPSEDKGLVYFYKYMGSSKYVIEKSGFKAIKDSTAILQKQTLIKNLESINLNNKEYIVNSDGYVELEEEEFDNFLNDNKSIHLSGEYKYTNLNGESVKKETAIINKIVKYDNSTAFIHFANLGSKTGVEFLKSIAYSNNEEFENDKDNIKLVKNNPVYCIIKVVKKSK